jgi:hypothetical protein
MYVQEGSGEHDAQVDGRRLRFFLSLQLRRPVKKWAVKAT